MNVENTVCCCEVVVVVVVVVEVVLPAVAVAVVVAAAAVVFEMLCMFDVGVEDYYLIIDIVDLDIIGYLM